MGASRLLFVLEIAEGEGVQVYDLFYRNSRLPLARQHQREGQPGLECFGERKWKDVLLSF